MKILARYFFKNVSVMFLIILFILFGVSFLIEVLSETASGFTEETKISAIISDSFGFSLEFINIIFSFIFLLSSVITVILMNNKFEMIAVRCIGMSDIKIAVPFFLFAVFAAAFFYINQSYLLREFRTTKKKQEVNFNWHANGNLLFFKSEKQNIAQKKYRVFVLNHSKTAIKEIIDVKDNEIKQRVSLDNQPTVNKAYYQNILDKEKNQEQLDIPFSMLEYHPFETIIYQASSGIQPADRYFVIVKKVSQVMIFFVYVWLAVILSNTPVRSYGFVNQIFTIIVIWLIIFGLELMGTRFFETKKLNWFWGGSLGLWFGIFFTALIYINIINQNVLIKRCRHFIFNPFSKLSAWK